jgi:hypothetical protein
MPNKRPYHTIIPSMLTYAQDNTLLGVMGAMVGCTTRRSFSIGCTRAVCMSLQWLWCTVPGYSTLASMTAHNLPLLIPYATVGTVLAYP